jgi:hypothetical protein
MDFDWPTEILTVTPMTMEKPTNSETPTATRLKMAIHSTTG